MIAAVKRTMALLLVAWLMTACGIAVSYRSAEEKTIRDYAGNGDYRQRVGMMALANTTTFTSSQIAGPFMQTFVENLTEAAADALVVMPGSAGYPSFLLDPPRLENGSIDAFSLSAMARQAGFNIVAGPALVNLRVQKRHWGFWFFRQEYDSLQLQAAATLYDTVTGARIDFEMIDREIEIDNMLAGQIQAGQEVQVFELDELAAEMGEILGERMGEAIAESNWATTVIAAEDSRVVIPAGSEVGIAPGDRFTVLDASRVLESPDGQRFVMPGYKIGEIVVEQPAAGQAMATVSDNGAIPVGSIVVPES